jgi:hypothetical protein
LTWRLTEGKILSVEGTGYLTQKDSLHHVKIRLIPGIKKNESESPYAKN